MGCSQSTNALDAEENRVSRHRAHTGSDERVMALLPELDTHAVQFSSIGVVQHAPGRRIMDALHTPQRWTAMLAPDRERHRRRISERPPPTPSNRRCPPLAAGPFFAAGDIDIPPSVPSPLNTVVDDRVDDDSEALFVVLPL